MHRLSIKKLILSALCLCAISVALSGMATANAASVTSLPPGFLIGDQDGIHVPGNGAYYIDVRDLQPGDIITKTLTIENLSQSDRSPEGKLPYQLTMRTEPLSSNGPVDLLNAVHLELKLDGKIIYSGRCRGDDGLNMIQNTLNLGEYNVGDRRVLDIILTVDTNMQLFEEKSEADFKWIFYAYRDVNPDPPKTGLLESCWPYLLIVGGVLLLGIILVLKKKRREQEAARCD